MGSIFILLGQLTQFYVLLVFVRIILTWIPNLDPYHPAVQMLHQVTEPVLEPARRLIPTIGMFDISPIVVIFALNILSDLFMQIGRGG